MESLGKSTVLVTGAAGGMGVAVCKKLVEKGLDVIGMDHNQTRLDLLSEELAGKSFASFCAELANPDLDLILNDYFGDAQSIHGLVNLAGVSVGNSIELMDKMDWDKSFSVNVRAPMLIAKWAVPRMKSAGGGSIVNVSSPVAIVGAKKPSYSASKAALLGLTMSLARDLGAHGIRVNALLPGPTITHMTSDWDEVKRKAIANGNFLKRLCRPEEIAAVIAFLLSDDSSFITGSVIDMTCGGMFGH